MSEINFENSNSLGEVRGVDTQLINVSIFDAENLMKTKVGHLVAVQGQDINEWLIGMVQKVWRNPLEQYEEGFEGDDPEDEAIFEENSALITLIGTYLKKYGYNDNHFTRALMSLPDIHRRVFPIEGDTLERFMHTISNNADKESGKPLKVGRYSLDRRAKAILNGDKLFQRHAALLGSTGSGKSWSVANILEQANELDYTNIILFDLHGEYGNLPYAEQYKIAGVADFNHLGENVLFLPFWLLTFEEIQSLIIDNKEQSAPNQSMAVMESIAKLKEKTLDSLEGLEDVKQQFTVNSPIPFEMPELIKYLKEKNEEEINTGEVYKSGDKKGLPKTVQGPMHNKLTRLILRLKNKVDDRRYGFLFQAPDQWNRYESLYKLASMLLGHRNIEGYTKKGIKVIDFSEVPSDVLPVMISLVSRLVYQIQFWTNPEAQSGSRHPILMVCDEAHLYLPKNPVNIVEKRSLEVFERISKEGRKYGVGLFVVSQRPSDVSTTILSQCNNMISLRLTNEQDQSVVKSLLPDSLGGVLTMLSGLEVGEAVVVGDSTILPTRIILDKPKFPPRSSTIDFWTRWDTEPVKPNLKQAVENLRCQNRYSVMKDET